MKVTLQTALIENGAILPRGTVFDSESGTTEEKCKALLAMGVAALAEGAAIQAGPVQPTGPTPEELAETRAYIERLEEDVRTLTEGRTAANRQLAEISGSLDEATVRITELESARQSAAIALAAITDAELGVVLKGRKVKAPADADRDALLLLITQTQSGQGEPTAASTFEGAAAVQTQEN